MDVLVTNVRDKCRFGYYMEAKFQMDKSAAIIMANDINHGYSVKLCNLPECDVRYLQRICNLKILNNNIKSINMKKIKICITKVIARISLMDYLVKSQKYLVDDARNKINSIQGEPIIIDVPNADIKYLETICEFTIEDNLIKKAKITSHNLNDAKQSNDTYKVTFTKVIVETFTENMDNEQINQLLNDPNVKSINIKK